MRSRPLLAIIAVAVCDTSCRHAPPAGHTSYAVVDDVGPLARRPVDASTLKVVEDMSVIVSPKPLETVPMPVYPPEALKAQLQDVRIAVTVTIDAQGRVVDVARSITSIPYTTAFQDEFFAAAAAAVRKWRFEPGRLAHLEPQADGRPLVTGTEPTSTKLTIAFTFSTSGTVTGEKM